MNSRMRRFARSVLAAVVIAVVLAFATIRKALYYAADPAGPKDCSPLSPAPASDANTLAAPADPAEGITWSQRGGFIDDVSCLNKTPVYGVVTVREPEDVSKALTFARARGTKVSIAGVRHSQGGHAFAKGALVLDMTKFNRMSLNERNRVLTVQSGATWHDIQNYLHPRFAVKAMQSTDIFTVGGSIAVNAHGMDHRAGSVAGTVRAMRVMMADGSIRTVSRTEDPRLFSLVAGGYGLFGIVLDADLDIVDNAVYRSERRILGYRDFLSVFQNEILPDQSYALMYGHLSTAPQSFLDEMILYAYRTVEAQPGQVPPLGEVSGVKLRRLVFNLSKRGPLAMRLKWFAEKHIEPRLESCSISRNQALGEAEGCFVSRNDPMHDSVPYLRNSLRGETDILHEYFIPRDQFVPFIDGLRRISLADRANLLNASVRIVHKEDVFLSYAPADMFAVVLYLNETTDAEGNERMVKLTRDLIDLTSSVGGRFFLPYQLHYDAAQLQRSYPEIGQFFAAKKEYDPEGVFTNTFYEKYSGSVGQ